jgi:hypothetical protein
MANDDRIIAQDKSLYSQVSRPAPQGGNCRETLRTAAIETIDNDVFSLFHSGSIVSG